MSDNLPAYFLVISEIEIRALLTMPQTIGLMRRAFLVISSQKAVVPLRTSIDILPYQARSLMMPVYVPELERIVVKVVSVYPRNNKQNIPNIHGKILLIDARNGLPLSLIDAEYITAMRTGAASGLATDLLARPASNHLAIFGTGAQALMQVQGVCAVRKINKICVYGTSKVKVEAFIKKLKHQYEADIQIGTQQSLKKAHIICTATDSLKPVFDAKYIAEGCHVNAIGSFKPTMQEIPTALMKKAAIFTDQTLACQAEEGEFVALNPMSLPHFRGELGEYLLKQIPGRTTEHEITLFKSVGNAVQDAFVADYIWRQYRGLNRN